MILGSRVRIAALALAEIMAKIYVHVNYFTSIIDIYFYEIFSTPNSQKYTLALQFLDTLSDIKIKRFRFSFN
jgi:hypothetical protein